MKIQKLSSLLLALLITTCISPLAASSNGDKIQATLPEPTINTTTLSAPTISTTAPTSPTTATIAYIPLVMNNKTSTPVPPAGNGMIADHTVISIFPNIPTAKVKAAAAIKTLFMHQSTGGYINLEGLACLAGLHDDPQNYPPECITYALHPYNPYDNRNWAWKVWDTPMADAIAKTDQWVSVVNAQQQNYQVLGMKFCYVDGSNQDFAYYRDHMLELERTYPNKIFIWSTSALWNDPGSACQDNGFNSCKNIYEFNRQVRVYANANNKPLYDMADIESDGGVCQIAGYEGLCTQYYSDSGGHPNIVGSIRLAKGFWWLMARISGWNGN